MGLHASKLEEAVAVDRETLRIPISGVLSSGQTHKSHVLIPQTFTYLLMKLCAFRDRMDDSDKVSVSITPSTSTDSWDC